MIRWHTLGTYYLVPTRRDDASQNALHRSSAYAAATGMVLGVSECLGRICLI